MTPLPTTACTSRPQFSPPIKQTAPPPRPKPARPRGGDSPFDRAQEVLDRLKREREK